MITLLSKLVLATTLLTQNTAPWPVALQTAVTQETRAFDGEISLVVKDLKTGQRYTHNAATPSYLASGVKIVVLLAALQQQASNNLSWQDTLVYGADNVRDGAHVLKNKELGTGYSIGQLAKWMMHYSDNAATDLLIDKIGIHNVNQAALQFGGSGFGPITSIIDVRRSIYQHLDTNAATFTARDVLTIRNSGSMAGRAKALGKKIGVENLGTKRLFAAYRSYYNGGKNSAPLENVAALLEKLHRGEVISPEVSQQALEHMLGCQTGKRRIRAGLPDHVPLAHKTGTQHKRLCDLGIFYPPDNRAVIFAICLKGFSSRKKAEAAVRRLTKTTYGLITARPAGSTKS